MPMANRSLRSQPRCPRRNGVGIQPPPLLGGGVAGRFTGSRYARRVIGRSHMRRNVSQIVVIGLVALCTSCTWVKMEPGAAQVRVLPIGQQTASCKRLGEIAVSVKDRVGPYERNSLAVRDELET